MIKKTKKFNSGGSTLGSSVSGSFPTAKAYSSGPLGMSAFESFRKSPQGQKWAAEIEGVKSEREPREQVMTSKGSVDSDDGTESRDEQTPLRKSGLEKTAKEKYAKGGSVGSASKRGDGIAQRGKTRGKMV